MTIKARIISIIAGILALFAAVIYFLGWWSIIPIGLIVSFIVYLIKNITVQ